MADHCPHFQHLSERVEQLGQKFVTDQVSSELAEPLIFKPDLDQLAAFRLLVHAEIEEFLEAKAKARIKTIDDCLKSGSAWMRDSPQLLALAIALRKALPTCEVTDSAEVNAYVQGLIGGARTAIKDNNGVKSAQFTFLSLCAGKTVDEVDSVLSGDLNSYGKDRGDVAHKSAARVQTLNAPSTELQTAKQLVAKLAAYFDVTAVPALPAVPAS